MKVKKVGPQELMLLMSKRSLLNFAYKEFLENRVSDLKMALIQ